MAIKAMFQDIQQFTRSAHYQVNQPWKDVVGHVIEKWVPDYGLELDPDFQRAHVWDEDRQVAYVEYILQGGRSSRDIYFNHPGWMGSFKGPFVLVDGKQRFEAVRRFMTSEIKAFGYYYHEYGDTIGSQPDFVFHVNDLKTRKEVLQWYLDLNTGGVVHTTEEINKVRELLTKEK